MKESLYKKEKSITKNSEDFNYLNKKDSAINRAASWAINKLKEVKKSTLLTGAVALTTTAAFSQSEDINKKADSTFTDKSKNKIENIDKSENFVKNKADTTFYYSENVNDPELKNSAGSLKEIMQKYRDGTVNSYEVHVVNSRFRKLREGKYLNNTNEHNINYKGKNIDIRLFDKGQVEAMKQYYKDIGLDENSVLSELVDVNGKPVKVLKIKDLNESFYEEVVNLHRTQFINGAIYGQDREYTRWVYINGSEGDQGMPVVILHGKVNNEDTVWLVGLGPCGSNHVKAFIDADCIRDIKPHNKSVNGE